MRYLSLVLVSVSLAGCQPMNVVSAIPPLPAKVTKCQWDTATDYFEGDEACEAFIRKIVALRLVK